MGQTTNFGLKTYDGNTLMNPFTMENANMETIDAKMKDISDAGIGTATELKTGTVHAITRADGDANVFRFTATSNYTAGDTFTVDGVQVTGLLTTGEGLGTGAYDIGAEVLCALVGTRLTLFVDRGSVTLASDSEKLGGKLPSYYATASDLTGVRTTANNANSNATSALNQCATLNTKVNNIGIEAVNLTVDKSAASGTAVTLCDTHLEPGLYLLVGYVRTSGSTNGTLYSRIGSTSASLTQNNPSATTRMSTAGSTALTFSTWVYSSTESDISLKVMQNSGSTLQVHGQLRGFKLKGF